ncbi:MAG TPA: SapC family protein, partial [Tianweitania sediminis]|nr:SapC family protein [Tianweitania sediminis]
MYKNLVALDPSDPRQRLHALSHYEHLAQQRLVPIFFIEMATLAAFWPTAWVRQGDQVEAVAMIGFADQPPLAQRLAAHPPEATPLLLQAYPLCLGPASSEGSATVLLDLSDAKGGTALFEGDELSAPAQKRTDILWLVGAERDRARAWNAELEAADAFELWRLRLSFDDVDVNNSDLHVISPRFLASDAYVSLAARHGPDFVSA